MAEVHVIGELVGGSDFPSGDLFCKWSVSHGSGWRVLEGDSEGQTQIDHPQDGKFAKWSHPIGTCIATYQWMELAQYSIMHGF